MKKAVIFDLDGTLLNSLQDLGNSTNASLRAFGLPARSMEEVRQFVGNGVGELIRRSVPAGTSAEIQAKCLAYFCEHYQTYMYSHTRPYDGVELMLEQLQQAGIKTGILSNKFQNAAYELREKYFKDKIEDVQGEQDAVPRKPDPSGLYLLMKRMQVHPQETVYVGDSPEDAETAQNAGVDFIGVTWGYRSLAKLQEAGTKYWIDAPRQLIPFIRRLFCEKDRKKGLTNDDSL